MTVATSVDDVVRMAIEDLFPDHSIPDQQNHLCKGKQHKAPDHLILGGEIAIERKSRNAVDRSRFYEKLQEIAKEQGAPFWAVGRINLNSVIRQLPDPASATREMTDFFMNQVMKTIRKSQKKFADYVKFVPRDGQVRVLILSDNTKIKEGTASFEYFIGRKMGAIDVNDDQAKIIDAIFYIKDPRYTIIEPDGHWFKAIVRKHLTAAQHESISCLVETLHHRISNYEPYIEAAKKFNLASLRICLI